MVLMPPYATCLETHLGGGAIKKRKPTTLRNISIAFNRQAPLADFACDYPVEAVCTHRILAALPVRPGEPAMSRFWSCSGR